VKYTLGTFGSIKGLTQVMELALNPSQEPMVISSKADVEQAWLAEAGHQFTQARWTPFLQPPFLTDFGELGWTSWHKAVLNGTYVPQPGCDPLIATFLQKMCCPPDVVDIQLRGVKAFNKEWQKVWEQTSLSPSQVHFGHYIAGTFSLKIAIINAKMSGIPQKLGWPLKQWLCELNVMLEKIPGNCNLEKLCIIILLEADFNYNNTQLGWAVMVSGGGKLAGASAIWKLEAQICKSAMLEQVVAV